MPIQSTTHPHPEKGNLGMTCKCQADAELAAYQAKFPNREYKFGDFVKVPFNTDNDHPESPKVEWMWVEVRYGMGDHPEILGKLANIPVYCLNLRRGDDVKVRRDQVREFIARQ